MEMTDLNAQHGVKLRVLKLKSNVQEERMKMDAKSTILALKGQLVTTTNSALDTAQLNVILYMNTSAPNHQQMAALNHQLAKQRNLTIKENTVMNNIAN